MALTLETLTKCSPSMILPPANKCIYCGATDVPLSDEHVVPYALNGNYILPNASCKKCAEITGRIENFVLRTMLGRVRVIHQMRTRRKKERPKSFPITFRFSDGSERTIDVPTKDFPPTIALPATPMAGVLRGLLPSTSASNQIPTRVWRYPGIPDVNALLDRYGATGCNFEILKFEIVQFSQFLAKMAHGFSFATLEQDYVPMAPPLILGRQRDPTFIVGSGDTFPVEAGDPNDIIRLQSGIHNPTGFIVVNIRFFPTAPGTPTYHVVVGRRFRS